MDIFKFIAVMAALTFVGIIIAVIGTFGWPAVWVILGIVAFLLFVSWVAP